MLGYLGAPGAAPAAAVPAPVTERGAPAAGDVTAPQRRVTFEEGDECYAVRPPLGSAGMVIRVAESAGEPGLLHTGKMWVEPVGDDGRGAASDGCCPRSSTTPWSRHPAGGGPPDTSASAPARTCRLRGTQRPRPSPPRPPGQRQPPTARPPRCAARIEPYAATPEASNGRIRAAAASAARQGLRGPAGR